MTGFFDGLRRLESGPPSLAHETLRLFGHQMDPDLERERHEVGGSG